ncbi:MAG: ATP synthase F1 subunit delta [bacterium]|nr:ATP synthase F1 subunit delta [bacterium]
MINKVIATRYAKALIRLASNKEELLVYQDELRKVMTVLEKERNIVKILNHPAISVKEKVKFVEELLSKECLLGNMRKFINLLVEKNRLMFLDDIYNSFENISSRLQNKAKGVVVVAVPISEKKKALIEGKFSKILGLKVELEVKINKGILGGVITQIGDYIVDGSVRRRLKMLRKGI